MDITYKFQKIPVSVNQQRFIAALKERAHLISSMVYIAGIAKTDILDYAEQGDITKLDSQMKMIRHQAIGMDAMLVFFYACLEEEKESASILFVKKNILTGVASQDDMVTSAGIMESRFSCHASQRNSRMPI
jgi:hypothetical protein